MSVSGGGGYRPSDNGGGGGGHPNPKIRGAGLKKNVFRPSGFILT